jgi:hypothetical protein
LSDGFTFFFVFCDTVLVAESSIMLDEPRDIVIFSFEFIWCQLCTRNWHSQDRKFGWVDGTHCAFKQVSVASVNMVCWINSGLCCRPRTKTKEIPHSGLQLCDVQMWFSPGVL